MRGNESGALKGSSPARQSRDKGIEGPQAGQPGSASPARRAGGGWGGHGGVSWDPLPGLAGGGMTKWEGGATLRAAPPPDHLPMAAATARFAITTTRWAR